ncbi:MAG TPA: hypothetical protein VKG84_04310, partial [Candidatus Acidoferrales bacterium]|nr:hypothetical protein [Candidatus Acidoferrales bacterium]
MTAMRIVYRGLLCVIFLAIGYSGWNATPLRAQAGTDEVQANHMASEVRDFLGREIGAHLQDIST